MMQIVLTVLVLVGTAAAKPSIAAPLVTPVAAPFVAATSYQYQARNYNELVPAAYVAPAPPAAYVAPAAPAAYVAPAAPAAYVAPAAPAAYVAPAPPAAYVAPAPPAAYFGSPAPAPGLAAVSYAPAVQPNPYYAPAHYYSPGPVAPVAPGLARFISPSAPVFFK